VAVHISAEAMMTDANKANRLFRVPGWVVSFWRITGRIRHSAART